MTDIQEAKTESQIIEEDQAQAKSVVQKEGPLKEMLVNYVGSVMAPEDGQVTVEMIINTLASEFPEFLFVVAKENWIRGYQQALSDSEQVAAEAEATAGEEKKEAKAKKKAKKKKKE